MKNIKRVMVIGALAISLVALTGCQSVSYWFKNFQQNFTGISMTIRTFDEDSRVIDEITGRNVSIKRDKTFDTQNSDGTANSDSSVLKVTVGSHELTHVGSSMIVSEKGLSDVFDEYAQTVDVTSYDRGLPMLNDMVHKLKAKFTGMKKTILIRSQNGTPLATYVGDKVTTYKTDVPKSTGLLIDGKYLFIYRCDYTIYDTALLR
jgi:hypothetical protein